MILTGNQSQSGTQQVLITSSQSENQSAQGIKFLNNTSSSYVSPTKNITLAQMGTILSTNKQHILPTSSPKQVCLKLCDTSHYKSYASCATIVIHISFYFFVECDTKQVATVFNISAIKSNHNTNKYCKITYKNPSCANPEYSGQVLNDDESTAYIHYVQVNHAAKSAESDH